jgi:Double-GTPase 2
VIVAPGTAPFADGNGGRRITVWGAPSTGKTTFLAALNVALDRQNEPWRVIGSEEAAAEALSRFERALVKDRVFPEATQAPELYRWELIGTVRRRVPRRWLGHKIRDQTVAIPLELVDAPGGSADPASGQARSRALFENIEQSGGIAFFFDPVRELESGDAFEHTNSVIHMVSQRMRDRTRLMPDGRLPHYVAVYVTKFDELRMVETARRFRMIDYDERGVPRVPDSEARAFLVRLCDQFPTRDPQLILNKLERAFRPDRVRYFVTSAIGFYVDPRTDRCDPEDFQNHLPAQAGRPAQIRGDVIPVNVAEPILWLAQA